MLSSFLSNVVTHRRHGGGVGNTTSPRNRDEYETIPNVDDSYVQVARTAASNEEGDLLDDEFVMIGNRYGSTHNLRDDSILDHHPRRCDPESHCHHHHHHHHLRHQHQQQEQQNHLMSSRIRRLSIITILFTTLYAIIVTTLNMPYNNMSTTSTTTTSSVADDGDTDISPPDGIGIGIDPDHTIPTLLSIVNPETGKYLNALENPLYDYFKSKRRHGNHNVNDENDESNNNKLVLPKLFLNKKKLKHPDESLTVSWTTGYHIKTKKAVITDNDLIAMYCSDNNDNHNEKMMLYNENFLEVATIGQVRATSMRHLLQQQKQKTKTATTNINSWYIPRFPILRKRICQFVLYSSDTTPNEEVNDGEGDVNESNNTTITIPIAYSDTIELYNPLTPTAIHLALGSTNHHDASELVTDDARSATITATTRTRTSMVVQFTTGYYDDNDVKFVPVVRYGKMVPTNASTTTNAGFDYLQKVGTSRTYTSKDMCESPANVTEAGKFYPPGMLHVVELSNLETNRNYWYQVAVIKRTSTTETKNRKGEEEDDDDLANHNVVWSDRYTFLSPPPVGSSTGGDGEEETSSTMPFSYAVYGDQGCPESGWGYDGGVAVSNAIGKEASKSEVPIRAVHHIGDLAYSNGAGHVWDEWFRILTPFSTMTPLMVGVGNHEYDHLSGGGHGKDPSGMVTVDGYRPQWGNFHNDSGGECGVPISNRFQMPQSKVPGSNGVFWYSYDFATVHTTVISSEHDLSPGSRQYNWLEEDLKSVNRTQTPWLVVESHRALYDRGGENGTWWLPNHVVGREMRNSIEPLLKQYEVDVVFAGHYHEYHRTCDGLYQDVCHNGGPMHITIGTGGATFLFGQKPVVQAWSAKFIQETYGYGRITVVDATSMHFEFVQVDASDDPEESDSVSTGQVLDDVWITRRRR